MKFIFTTDLHGDEIKYKRVLSFSEEHDIKLIHLGADLLPKGGQDLLKTQKKFVKGFLKNYFSETSSKGIRILAHFGNDDIYSIKPYFKEYATLLDETPYELEGFIFKAYGYTPDYPFSLKTACKLDYRGWQRPFVEKGIDISNKGFVVIPDIDSYLEAKTTIEEDMKELSGGPHVIISSHCPPLTLGLDICSDWRAVGSRSLLRWIEKEQPLICLCGHIHESYGMTKIWKAKVGNTLVIQPGQGRSSEYNGSTHLVFIDISSKGIISDLILL